MIVITEPRLSICEQILSKPELTPEIWNKALEEMRKQEYVPKSILLKRAVRPKFPMHVTLTLLADWDPQLEDADMVIILKRLK